MLLHRIALFLFVSLSSQSICTSNEIFNNNVGKCDCRDFDVTACPNRCPVDPSACTTVDSGIYLVNCGSDCTSDKNKDCNSCGVWLHSLCLCLKNPTLCEQSAPGGGEGWVKLSGGNLATTNVAIKNILALQTTHAGLAGIGWDFGQRQSDPSSQALAINPARTVTQDQIHMHICPKNTDMRDFLSSLYTTSPSFFSALTAVKLPAKFQQGGQQTMWCQASQTKNQPISGGTVSAAINNVLQMKQTCDYNVAAAMMRDGNGYTWACVTADNGDTEHRFLVSC